MLKPIFTAMLISLLTGLSFCAVEIRLGSASGSTYTDVARGAVWSKAQISTVDYVDYTTKISILGSFVEQGNNAAVDTYDGTFASDLGIAKPTSSMNSIPTRNVDLTEVNVIICPCNSFDNQLHNDGSTRNQWCICINPSSGNTVPSKILTEDTLCSIFNGSLSRTTTYYSSVSNLKHTASNNFETNLGDDCYLSTVNYWSLRGLATIVTRLDGDSNGSSPSTNTASLNFSTNSKICSMFGVTAGGTMPHCW